MDHGFLKLDHVRIPRENMLNRFAKVGAREDASLHCLQGGRHTPRNAAAAPGPSLGLGLGHPSLRGSGVPQTSVKSQVWSRVTLAKSLGLSEPE